MKHTIRLTVNGRERELEVESRRLLAEVLRDDLGLTGTKRGCETNACGACTALLDGRSVHTCSVLAVDADGRQVTTIEGIGGLKDLHPVQEAFLKHLGYQCGFCTPGMVMTTVAMLRETPHPTADEVRRGLTGNLCRCTGYVKIVESVMAAAQAVPEPPA